MQPDITAGRYVRIPRRHDEDTFAPAHYFYQEERTAVNPEITLASGSPRRRDLLRQAGLEVQIMPVEVDETPRSNEAPDRLAARLADEKARAAARQMPDGGLVIAADTIVVHRGEILGKPADAEQAAEMLMDLKASQHEVMTGLALLDEIRGRIAVEVVVSRVPMRDYTMDEVAEYIAGGSPLDKAGAYGIQDDGFQPVAEVLFEDCFTNVMGLPLCRLEKLFRDLELESPAEFVETCFLYGRHDLTWGGDEEPS